MTRILRTITHILAGNPEAATTTYWLHGQPISAREYNHLARIHGGTR